MRRLVAVLAGVIAAVLAVPVAAGAATTTRYVDLAGQCGGRTPCYTTIQDAIDSADPGDAVRIGSGVFHEQVVVDEVVTVSGAGNGTVIDSDGTGAALSVSAPGAAVRRLAVTDASIGIAVVASSVSVSEVKVTVTTAVGIYTDYGVRNAVMRKLDVSGIQATGIEIFPGGEDNQILDSKVRGNVKGIELYSTDGTTIRNTEVSGNDTTGVQIGWSSGWAVTGSRIHHNGGNGVLTDTSGEGAISGNEVRSNGENGIAEAGNGNSGVVTVSANRVESNVLSGIALRIGAVSGLVVGNRVRLNGRYAVEVVDHPYGNGGNLIVGNDLRAGRVSLGVALDDNQVGTPNFWRSNYYSDNVPFASPYLVPGTAGVYDTSPMP